MPVLPPLEQLIEQATTRSHKLGVPLSRARRELAREHGFRNWSRLTRHLHAHTLDGIERALVLADPDALGAQLTARRTKASAEVDGLPPLLALLRRSIGTSDEPASAPGCCSPPVPTRTPTPARTAASGGRRRCSPRSSARTWRWSGCSWNGARPATRTRSTTPASSPDTGYLDALYAPGFERTLRHKLDFEDAAGLRWFLAHGVDVNEQRGLHWAIARGRGLPILRLLLDAGADVDLPQGAGDDPARRPLALAARCGHLAAHQLLLEHGARAELDPVDSAVLAVARGESTRLPAAPPAALGTAGDGDSWLLGQFALLGRTEVVRGLLDTGMPVDGRGWSNFTPLDQAAMHGRTDTVALLLDRGADVHDCAFDEDGPTPLDCAVWGSRNNRAADGDYPGTVALLVAAGAPTQHEPPTGDRGDRRPARTDVAAQPSSSVDSANRASAAAAASALRSSAARSTVSIRSQAWW